MVAGLIVELKVYRDHLRSSWEWVNSGDSIALGIVTLFPQPIGSQSVPANTSSETKWVLNKLNQPANPCLTLASQKQTRVLNLVCP